MTEDKAEPKQDTTPPGLRKEFTSSSKDPGVIYVENFHRRKISTISKADIIKALENAAQNGGNDSNKSHLSFVSELMNTKLLFLTTKQERKEIFLKAALKDKEKQN